jgi:ribosomal protein L19
VELNQEQIDKLKSAHGELHQVDAGDGERAISVIVKVPNRERWNRFKAQVQDAHRKALAMEALVRDCVVHPVAAELDRIIEVRPGLVETFGGKIAELAGLEETVATKKL